MNSSVLVSGFVVVGFGAMAILFNPFGSSESTSSSSTGKYEVAAKSSKVKTATSPVSTASPVSAAAAPEPFVWENKKETVASTGIFDNVDSKPATKKVAKSKKSTSSSQSFGSQAYKTSQTQKPKQQTVSKPAPSFGAKSASSFGGKSVSTADADLNDFFGPSKPATKVSKTTKPLPRATQAPATKAKPKPVRVASKPAVDSVKPASSWPTQEVKTSPSKDSDMFTFSAAKENGSDDAPMLAAVESDEFEAPSFDPIDEAKGISKTDSSKQNISGSLESVIDKPAAKKFDIENPLQTRLNVTFLANGEKVSLKPGQHFVIRQTDDIQVKFSRGGSFGFEEKSLSEGDYQFSVTRKEGWKLTQ